MTFLNFPQLSNSPSHSSHLIFLLEGDSIILLWLFTYCDFYLCFMLRDFWFCFTLLGFTFYKDNLIITLTSALFGKHRWNLARLYIRWAQRMFNCYGRQKHKSQKKSASPYRSTSSTSIGPKKSEWKLTIQPSDRYANCV